MIRIVVVAAIAVAALFAWRTYGGKVAATKQTDAEQAAMQQMPLVVTDTVKEIDASEQVSEYTGRVEPMQTVSVKPKVDGEIVQVCFKEGSLVRAGQLLFRIDPVSYQAKVDLCRAQLESAEAELDVAEKYFARVKSAEERAVSAADRDKAENNVLLGRAAVASAKASLRLAEIDLSYTDIKAPITGKIGKAMVTKGNYVTASSETLAEIVQMDPIRVSYTLPDREYLDLLDSFKANGNVFRTKLLLSNGTEFEATGRRDFENNVVDKTTGTVGIMLRYENADGKLIPGALVRVQSKPQRSMMTAVIPQTAVMADSKGDFIYTVGEDGTANIARVKLGRYLGNYRELCEGVSIGTKIVTAGLQQLRPGVKVQESKADAPDAASDMLEETEKGK
ncbi:MAG: efflux RND transporter periplasmic adaptor subunit [Synergistes sp.]|nr:efflux RND transporter periplasmic adaptor subunit [Synergistes sp.]